VRALAEAVLARTSSIDVLIHSAGGMPPSGARTGEGVDRGFAQNFLGGFLLTRLLEERLLASAPARVIAVGSSAHRMVKRVDLDEFMRPANSPMGAYQKGSYQMRSYQTAKLAVTTWIYGLARRWAGRGVTANVLDPGMVKGKFGEQFEAPPPIRTMMNHVFPFFLAVGTKRGAEQYVRLAADPTLEDVSGMYFLTGKKNNEASSPLTLDPTVQKRIDEAAETWAAPFLPAPLR
jgi:NAD(P)-dependent dehydrogenase (short-subunit alcohol dehydrogenase family)